MAKQKKKKVHMMRAENINKAHHRNEFIKKIKAIIDKQSDHPVSHHISSKDLDTLFAVRIGPIQIQLEEDSKLHRDQFELCKKLVMALLKTTSSEIEGTKGLDFSVYDVFTIGVSLACFQQFVERNRFLVTDEVKANLEPFNFFWYNEKLEPHWTELKLLFGTVKMVLSDLQSKCYCISVEHLFYKDLDLKGGMVIKVGAREPEKSSVIIRNSRRPITRLGWILPDNPFDFSYTMVKAEDLGMPLKGKKFPVYIQAHAFSRLTERIDNVLLGVLHLHTYLSFTALKFHRTDKGRLLFEYRIDGIKLGYFRGDIFDGKIILRTFLFILNNGTPEAHKLKKSTGLSKEDMKYLSLDKLSTFVHSDIDKNERVKNIFVKAGCESLFEIPSNTFYHESEAKEKQVADYFLKYLKVDHTYVEDDLDSDWEEEEEEEEEED